MTGPAFAVRSGMQKNRRVPLTGKLLLSLAQLLAASLAEGQLLPPSPPPTATVGSETNQNPSVQNPPTATAPTVHPQLMESLKALLTKNKVSSTQIKQNYLKSIYQLNADRPFWVDGVGLNALGLKLVELLGKDPDKQGLLVSYYVTDDLRLHLDQAKSSMRALAELDVLLTHAFATYLTDLSTGRIQPKDPSQNVQDIEMKKNPAPDSKNIYALITAPEGLSSAIDKSQPQTLTYQHLVKALERLQEAKKIGGWPAFSKKRPTLRPGMSHSNVPAIRVRLTDLGYLDSSRRQDSSTLYDAELAEAVILYRSRNFLGDGADIGTATFKALDLPLDKAIEQIRSNMEKWRFFPRTPPRRYLFVDMGRQELDIMEDNILIDRMRVVVGRQMNGTPTMTDKITSVVVNPYWFPPAGIVVKEIIPHMLNDSGYLSRTKMRIFRKGEGELSPDEIDSIGWRKYTAASLPYQFRQDSGPNSALGLLKFNLTNAHSIYMHDTDSRNAFERDVRYLSHGCIRLQRPKDLATYLLKDQGITIEQLEAKFQDATIKAQQYPIPPIATLILGTTVTTYPDGVIVLGPDPYGQDARVIAAMDGRVLAIPLVAPLSLQDSTATDLMELN